MLFAVQLTTEAFVPFELAVQLVTAVVLQLVRWRLYLAAQMKAY